MEIWKPIIGFEGLFEISNLGRARSLPRKVSNHTGIKQIKGQIIKSHPRRHGYLCYNFSVYQKHKSFSVHRLIAIHFIPNPYNKAEVNHINGIKTDNRIKNLEWVTHLENMQHAVKKGLHDAKGEKAPSSKLTNKQADKIRSLKGKLPQREIAKMFGVTHSTIGGIHRGISYCENMPAEQRREMGLLTD